jgi:FMN phosphatase YigB (HAD superfamily)
MKITRDEVNGSAKQEIVRGGGFDYGQIRALLVDIDDTVIRFRRGVKTDSLLGVLQSAAVSLGGLVPEEAARRIGQVKEDVRWWHFSDFIVALNLNPKRFWEYAHEYELAYLEPAEPEMKVALERIRQEGILLYVTSNNPSSGILHKLAIAGLATIQGAPLFSQLLGATELQAMKWEPVYWKKVLAHIGFVAQEVAVLGDNLRDDLEIPQSIGIPHTFLINRDEDRSVENSATVTHVQNFEQVADCLMGRVAARRRAPQLTAAC